VVIAYSTGTGGKGTGTGESGVAVTVNNGDFVVAHIAIRSTSVTVSSLTVKAGVNCVLLEGPIDNSTDVRSYLYYYKSTANQGSNAPTLTLSGSARHAWTYVVYTGVASAAPYWNGSPSSASGSAASVANATVAVSSLGMRMVISGTAVVKSANAASTITVAPGNSETERQEQDQVGTSTTRAVSSQLQEYATTTSPRTMTAACTCASSTLQWVIQSVTLLAEHYTQTFTLNTELAAGTGGTFGNTNIGTSDDYGGARKVGVRYQLTEAGTITSLSWYFATDKNWNHFKLALYSDNSGSPDALLAQTGAETVTPGWHTITLTSNYSASVGYYWITLITDGDFNQRYDSGSSNQTKWFVDPVYADEPTSTFGTPTTNQAWAISAYGTYSSGATTYTKTFTLNTELLKSQTKTFTLNTELLKNLTKTFTLNSELKIVGAKAFTLNAELLKSLTKTFTLNSELLKQQTKAFTLNSELLKNQTSTFTFNTNLLKSLSQQFTYNTELLKALTKNFTLNSELQAISLTKTFTLNSELQAIYSKSFTLNAELLKTLTKTFSYNTELQLLGTKTFTYNAELKTVFTKDFTFNAELQISTPPATTPSVGDAWLRKGTLIKPIPLSKEELRLIRDYLRLKLE